MSSAAALQVDPDEIGYDRWSYVAMGEYHVYRPLAPNASYSGALEYTSFNIWGELQEEREGRVRGKGIVEYDLDARKRVFHPLVPARRSSTSRWSAAGAPPPPTSTPPSARTSNRGLASIDDKIVRQVVIDIPRHVVAGTRPQGDA